MFVKLPPDVQELARNTYRRFRENPYHPSLQLKEVDHRTRMYSARVGLFYRVLGIRTEPDVIVWGWIGTHAEYDKLLKR